MKKNVSITSCTTVAAGKEQYKIGQIIFMFMGDMIEILSTILICLPFSRVLDKYLSGLESKITWNRFTILNASVRQALNELRKQISASWSIYKWVSITISKLTDWAFRAECYTARSHIVFIVYSVPWRLLDIKLKQTRVTSYM